MRMGVFMRRKESSVSDDLKFMHLKKVVTLAELAVHLNCSRRTVQRRLADWHAINSYNRNGRYYTLPNIAQFNVNGLWRYRDVFFSRFGSLPETFVSLVNQSSAGLTAPEAGELLGLRPSSFIWSLHAHPSLKREKHLGRYVYLSSDPERYQEQFRQRKLMLTRVRTPTDSEAVLILLEKIRHPSLDAEQLSRRLKMQKQFVAPETINHFFVHHNLTVKKTLHSI